MLSLPGVGIKDYARTFEAGEVLPEILCPAEACHGRQMHGHGWYWRWVLSVWTRIRRVRCLSCGVTHALLPEDLCAYADGTLKAVEDAVEASGACGGPDAARRARAASKASTERGPGTVRQVAHWLSRFDAVFVQRLEALLPAVPGTWLQRVRATVGTAASALVRLRHWLWDQYRVFFGGPAGLWRGGRPRTGVHGGSTYLVS